MRPRRVQFRGCLSALLFFRACRSTGSDAQIVTDLLFLSGSPERLAPVPPEPARASGDRATGRSGALPRWTRASGLESVSPVLRDRSLARPACVAGAGCAGRLPAAHLNDSFSQQGAAGVSSR